MPFVRITVSGPALSPKQVRLLHIEITQLMASVLGKRADLTSVLVEQPATADWAIGGTPVRIAVHLEATITAGTNSPEQKARFIEKAMGLLTSVLGSELNPATYIVVNEVPANAWDMTAEHRKAGCWLSDMAANAATSARGTDAPWRGTHGMKGNSQCHLLASISPPENRRTIARRSGRSSIRR